MAKTVLKVEVPKGLEPEFRQALHEVTKKFMQNWKWSVARKIRSKSKLTEQQANELGEEVKTGIAKRHNLI